MKKKIMFLFFAFLLIFSSFSLVLGAGCYIDEKCMIYNDGEWTYPPLHRQSGCWEGIRIELECDGDYITCDVTECDSGRCDGNYCAQDYECESNFDCPIKIITEKYCQGNLLKQKITENQCKNHECVMEQSSDDILESCSYNCGMDTDGKYKCLTQPTIDVYRLEDNECNLIQILPELRQNNDYDTLEECQIHISNINWKLILSIITIVGIIFFIAVGYVIYKRKK